MTGEIVNLRQMRKRKKRAEAEIEAASNRAAHGRPKAEKSLSKALETKRLQRLESGRLEQHPSKSGD